MTDHKLNRIHKLISILGDPRLDRSSRAEAALIAVGRDAVEPLIAVADSPSREIRSRVAWILGKIGDPRGFDTILKLTRDSHDFVRYEAAWALGVLGDERAIEPLIEFLGNEDEAGAGGSAGNALAEMGEKAIPRLIEVARSSSSNKRACALYTLGGNANEAVIDLFEYMLDDSDREVRIAAIEALAQSGEEHPQEIGQRCLELIRTRIDDSDAQVREVACFWTNDISEAMERQGCERVQPRSHRLRLIR